MTLSHNRGWRNGFSDGSYSSRRRTSSSTKLPEQTQRDLQQDHAFSLQLQRAHELSHFESHDWYPSSDEAANSHTSFAYHSFGDRRTPRHHQTGVASYKLNERLPGSYSDHIIPDLMIPNLEIDQTRSRFERLHISQPDLSAIEFDHSSSIKYSIEEFEQQFPFDPSSNSSSEQYVPALDERRTTSSFDRPDQDDCMLANPRSPPMLLTEATQTDLEGIFNPTTGRQHKIPAKKKRRKPSPGERLNRARIRQGGGQCPLCKRRKRKCDISHLVSESSGSPLPSEKPASLSTYAHRGMGFP